jgi:hypothetical protein
MPSTGCGPVALTASCSLLALSLPTDDEDWITTKRRDLYGNPQGNICGPLRGLPESAIPRCRNSPRPNVVMLPVVEIDRKHPLWRTKWNMPC